jgi:hypothetical protein
VRHRSYQKGHSVARGIRIEPSGFLDQVTFSLGEGKRLPVGLVFNTRCQVKPFAGLTMAPIDTLGQAGAFRYWTERQEYSATEDIRLELDCEGTRLGMTLTGSGLGRLIMAKTPDSEVGKTRTGIYVETVPVTAGVIDVRLEPL